jgi:hypothetical protein
MSLIEVPMKLTPSLLLATVLSLGFAAPALRADEKKTPEQVKAEKKEKELQKAKDDLEKSLKGKKADPAPALNMLDKLANQVGLEVGPSKDLVNKIISKKIPWDQANIGADTKMREAVDTKTFKVDAKKFQAEFAKWISEWKPEPKEKDAPKK